MNCFFQITIAVIFIIFRLEDADTNQISLDNGIAPELDEREKVSTISMPNGVTLRRVSDIRK
jgi:hypothetical protein